MLGAGEKRKCIWGFLSEREANNKECQFCDLDRARRFFYKQHKIPESRL